MSQKNPKIFGCALKLNSTFVLISWIAKSICRNFKNLAFFYDYNSTGQFVSQAWTLVVIQMKTISHSLASCSFPWQTSLSVPDSQDFSSVLQKTRYRDYLSRIVRKPDFCLGENKGADKLRGNREADQRLCFRYSDSTIPLLLKSEISSF